MSFTIGRSYGTGRNYRVPNYYVNSQNMRTPDGSMQPSGTVNPTQPSQTQPSQTRPPQAQNPDMNPPVPGSGTSMPHSGMTPPAPGMPAPNSTTPGSGTSVPHTGVTPPAPSTPAPSGTLPGTSDTDMVPGRYRNITTPPASGSTPAPTMPSGPSGTPAPNKPSGSTSMPTPIMPSGPSSMPTPGMPSAPSNMTTPGIPSGPSTIPPAGGSFTPSGATRQELPNTDNTNPPRYQMFPDMYLPYMNYGTPMGVPLFPLYGYDNSADLDKDIEYMRQLYPITARAIQNEINKECDLMEYDGSVMFDEYPDQVTLDKIADRIYEKVNEMSEEPQLETQNLYLYPPRHRINYLRDLVSILLLNEIFNRRRMYRSRRRWY